MVSNRVGSARQVSGSNTRTVPLSHALSGMMLNAVPARTWVTLTTTSTSGSTLRLAMVWSAVTMCARHTTGSAPRWGIAACAPLPSIVIVNSSTAAMKGPGVIPTLPRSRVCHTCRPNAAAGRGSASAPSRIIASAPPPTSSAGWNTSRTAPGSVADSFASRFAMPSSTAVWQS